MPCGYDLWMQVPGPALARVTQGPGPRLLEPRPSIPANGGNRYPVGLL